MITRSIGKNTISSGNKMQVHMHGFERSTHNLSYAWRNTQTVGTLVPFMCEVGLPADTFDIDLRSQILTHPTTGPLYGSFIYRAGVWVCPIRLYNAMLHNNALGVGMDMGKVKLPKIKGFCSTDGKRGKVAPSNILSYLGIRHFGTAADNSQQRSTKNATALIAYYDIFKNYFANKQEKKFPVISNIDRLAANQYEIQIYNTQTQNFIKFTQIYGGTSTTITEANAPIILINRDWWNKHKEKGVYMNYTITSPTPQVTKTYNLTSQTHSKDVSNDTTKTKKLTDYNEAKQIPIQLYGTSGYLLNKNTDRATINNIKGIAATIEITSYDLEDIDKVREYILSLGTSQFIIDGENAEIPEYLNIFAKKQLDEDSEVYAYQQDQGGLCLTTYNSDIFNNWINSETIDGDNGINEITAIDTSSGKFTLDTLNLAKKTYNLLNRIAISGGTYKDWMETVYDINATFQAETPIYEGGYSSEIEFQEVINQAQTTETPLGQLAGRGVQTNSKGGKLHIKIQEPSYVIGLCWITPRVDYCQGNRWDIYLDSLDDLHKPQMDGIGFQDLNTDLMVGETLKIDTNGNDIHTAIGKQPAWVNYMTNYNRNYGNFAKKTGEEGAADAESFMVLNRWYDKSDNGNYDYSTYIDPTKYNYIFAETDLNAMNFWVQMGVGITARRKMSAKIMPTI